MFIDGNTHELFWIEVCATGRLSARAVRILSHTRKVMNSCVDMCQLENSYKWAWSLIENMYTEWHGAIANDNLRVIALACIQETFKRKSLEIDSNNLSKKDAIFIQEVINDLERHGYPGQKAREMLFTWSGELREKAGLSGRRKRFIQQMFGKRRW